MNSYEMSRKWFDWCFDNPDRIKPHHTALYFFCIEHCNRLGWQPKFGLPTEMAKSAIGIHSYNTYISTLNDLIEFGFIKIISKSKNQFSSNIIALSYFDEATTNALDKAMIKHGTKQHTKQGESTIQSTSSINKQINIEQGNHKPITPFERFWILYDKKEDKEKCRAKFLKLPDKDIEKIFQTLPNYLKIKSEKRFRKNPLTYLNGQCWNDEIEETLEKPQYLAPAKLNHDNLPA